MAAPAAIAKTGPMSKTSPVTQKQLPMWTWEGKTRTGEIRRGEMEATDESQVSSRLRAMALVNLKVRKKAFAIKLKLPGLEAELSRPQTKEGAPAESKGEIGFRSSPLTVNVGPH